MRILYHHRTQSGDAQGLHIEAMVNAFRALGHEVEIVSLIQPDRMNGSGNNARFLQRVAHWAPGWLYDLMTLCYNFYGYHRLTERIASMNPDMIYERYALNMFCGILASRRFGIPLVLEVNAPLYYEQKHLGKLTFKRVARYLERWICSNSARTYVVSESMKRILVQEGGIPESHIVVMPNGIDPESFSPTISGDEIRNQWDLSGKVVIGFVGWFREWHRLDLLLEIMNGDEILAREAKLLLVGDGPAFPDLRRFAEEHDLLSSVVFTGSVDWSSVPEHIAAMDIAVQPSAPPYACPMKILEYMAMAKCVIAPNQSNVRELLEDGLTGLLFQPRDKNSLRVVLREMVRDRGRREIIGHEAYLSVFKRGFLWRANAEKVVGQMSL